MTVFIHQWLSSLESFDESFFFLRCSTNETLLICLYTKNLPLFLRLFYIDKIEVRIILILNVIYIINSWQGSFLHISIIIKYFDINFLHFLNRIPLIRSISWIQQVFLRVMLLSLPLLPYLLIARGCYLIIIIYYFYTIASIVFHCLVI